MYFVEFLLSETVFIDRFAPIHAEAPPFVEMSVKQEVLETGIKVVDLLAPYAKGGKIGKYLGSLSQNGICTLFSKELGALFTQPLLVLFCKFLDRLFCLGKGVVQNF